MAMRFGPSMFGDHILVIWYWQSDIGNLFVNLILQSWELASDFSNKRIIVWQLILQQWHNSKFGNLVLAAKYLAIRFYKSDFWLLPIWLCELENLVTAHPSTMMQPRVARMKVRTLPARGADLFLCCQNVIEHDTFKQMFSLLMSNKMIKWNGWNKFSPNSLSDQTHPTIISLTLPPSRFLTDLMFQIIQTFFRFQYLLLKYHQTIYYILLKYIIQRFTDLLRAL